VTVGGSPQSRKILKNFSVDECSAERGFVTGAGLDAMMAALYAKQASATKNRARPRKNKNVRLYD
jgi:hypothetical protein